MELLNKIIETLDLRGFIVWFFQIFNIDEKRVKQEIILLLLLLIAQELLLTYERYGPYGEIFDHRLHWIPEVMVYFFLGRIFVKNIGVVKYLVTDWGTRIIWKMLRFGELSYPYFYQMFVLSVIFIVVGYYTRHRFTITSITIEQPTITRTVGVEL